MITTASRIARLPRSPRLYAFMLAHLALLLPLGVFADTYGDYTYTVSGDEAIITGYSGLGGSVTIPSTIGLGNYPVAAIGYEAFYKRTSLTDVTIPNSITDIGARAFYGCTNLTATTIPSSVTNIGYQAFYECRALTAVTIPDSVITIGSMVFSQCTHLTSVTIGNHVAAIASYAFSHCSSLTSVTLPNSVTSI
ncbi:MAG: leucine-rich repeat domain-containing protein, partial [Kiritimatiellae bacterium]|nr:leucine-rich repeat domain-containing protein [Kiritimatiellia bacterium]